MAKAAANRGASVETEPSIKPARPGWTYCRTNMRLRVRSSSARTPGQFRREAFATLLHIGQITEQLAHTDILRLFGGLGAK